MNTTVTPHAVTPDAVRLMGRKLRQAPSADLLEQLLTLTHNPVPKVARYAVLALAAAEGHPAAELRLLTMWADPQVRPEMRRAIAKSLGTVGSAASLELLTNHNQVNNTLDPELNRITKQAILILARRFSRPLTESAAPRGIIRGELGGTPVRIRVQCRNGLERISCVSLPGARILGPGRLELWHGGPLAALFACRTFESLALTLPPQRLENNDIAAAAARALSSPVARTILGTLTSGPIRYRLAWKGEGRQNQLLWRTAALAQSLWPDLINDPRASTWEAELHVRGEQLYVDLVPKALIDPRFSYRMKEVPAASHPPLAAALARVGGVKADDVVWDPFVGSGTELIERALLGPTAAIMGSDRDPVALKAAATNIAAAQLEGRIALREADALTMHDQRPTLILTNPPLGRRVARDAAVELLDAFLRHAAAVLATGGRLVWVSPDAKRHQQLAASVGLCLAYEQRVDMGGFPATIQRFDRH